MLYSLFANDNVCLLLNYIHTELPIRKKKERKSVLKCKK